MFLSNILTTAPWEATILVSNNQRTITTSLETKIVEQPQQSSEIIDWERLDINLQFPCGHYKCFFELLPAERNEGYIIALNGTYQMMEMKRGWDLVTKLQFGSSSSSFLQQHQQGVVEEEGEKQFRHFLLGPPIQIPIYDADNDTTTDTIFTRRMDEIATTTSDRKWLRRIEQIKEEANQTHMLVVQHVKKAPSQSLLVFCNDDKRKLTQRALQNFKSKVHNLDRFSSTIDKEIQYLLEFLEEVPGLWRDFQIFIDNQGRIYHLDLDRYWYKNRPYIPREDYTNDCVRFVRCMIHQILTNATGNDDDNNNNNKQSYHHQGGMADSMNC